MALWDALSVFSVRATPNHSPLKKYNDVGLHRWALMMLLFSSGREHFAFGGTVDEDSVHE